MATTECRPERCQHAWGTLTWRPNIIQVEEKDCSCGASEKWLVIENKYRVRLDG